MTASHTLKCCRGWPLAIAVLLGIAAPGIAAAQPDEQAARALELFAQRERVRAFGRGADYVPVPVRPAPFDSYTLQAQLYATWRWAPDRWRPLPPGGFPCPRPRYCPWPYPLYPSPPGGCLPDAPCW